MKNPILWRRWEMNLFSFIKKRFLHRFILVYQNDINVGTHIYDIKNDDIINQNSEDFVLENKEEFTQELKDFLNKAQEEVTRSYIVTILNSQGQGIVPTCSTSEFKKYSIDRRYTYNICVDGIFSNYVTKIEINWLQKIYKDVGIDLIFSPFCLLYDLIKDEETGKDPVLYILYFDNNASLMIKKDKKILYGSFFNTTESSNPLYSDFEEDGEVDEDEFEIEDDMELEESDFEMEIQEGDDFENPQYQSEVALVEENKTFTKFISNSLKEFYSNDVYESSFVDRVKIFAEEEMDKSVIEYIESELFLNTEFSLIELDPIVLKFSKKEVIGV